MSESKVKTVNKQMAKGAIWMVFFKFVEKGIGLFSTVILARLLLPEDFGLVAMAMVVVAFIELLRAFNFDVALIQNQDASEDHYNTAWTFNVIAGCFIAVIMVAGANAVASFYNDERLVNIMYVLSIGVFISGFENIGVVAFRKDLSFHKEFVFLLGKKVIGVTMGLTLAFTIGNYWALIGGMVAARFGIVLLSFLVHPYRPKICLKSKAELFSFSAWLLLNNFLFFLNKKLPELIVGKLIGPKLLGLYSVSYEISNMPTTELVAPINRAVFPGYSRLNNDLAALNKSYLDTISYIAFLAIPAACGFAAVAPVLVPVVLGEKWNESIYVMQLLALAGAFITLQTNSGSVFMAIGKPRITTILMTVRLIILIPSFVFMVKAYGLIGAGMAVLIASTIMLPVGLITVCSIMHIKGWLLIARIYRPVISGIVMGLILLFIQKSNYFEFILNAGLVYLLMLVFLGASIYIVSSYFLWFMAGKPDGPESYFAANILRKYRAQQVVE